MVFEDFTKKVDSHIVDFRNKRAQINESLTEINPCQSTYLSDYVSSRFGSGEGKITLGESLRGVDLFILVDVCNYSLSYSVCGQEHHMSPDDYFQELKRVISAAKGKANRITVVMPFLFSGRQHRRSGRESLDCAVALKEIVNLGVDNIVTFDAHDPRVANAIPQCGFDNFMPSYQFLKALVRTGDDIHFDNDHLMIIAPDEGATNRALYLSNILNVDMGMFYKRRDYSKIVNGKNPIVAHEFLGDSLVGKDVIIIDDMISSGGSMLDVAKQLKERQCRRVYICTTYGLFTDGFKEFNEYYEKGYINKVITTNLNYCNPGILTKEYYQPADMTKFLATIIDSLNFNISVEKVLSPTEKIQKLLKKVKESQE